MMRTATFLICVLFVTACAVSEPPPPKAAENRYFLALTPKSLGRNLSLSQLVTGEFGGNTYRARYEVEIIGDRLTIVGLSPIGLTLFTLIQSGDAVTMDSRLKEAAGFDPRYTLFDLYLSYWPAEVLERALEQNGLTLDVDARNSSRTVLDADGRTVATVTYPPGRNPGGATVIAHVEPPYRLRILPLNAPGQK
ncbi:MAG: hypothetical protein ACI9JL_001228 [Paracoccaceae bacterium]|jgi:hypothetical protein